MLKILAHLFIPRESNNYKAKSLHISSLSTLMVLIMVSQIALTFFSRIVPGVLGIATSITAQELIDLTNAKRQENGLPVLTQNPILSQAAQQKAADMIVKNYWAHTAPDGTTPWSFFKNVNYQYVYAGENLARDFSDSPGVVDAWMNSPTHRDNILSSRYREMGIAVVHDTFQGQPTTLVVQLFGTQVSAVPVEAKEQVVKTVGQIGDEAEAVLAEVSLPRFDSFSLTKAVSISLTIILLLTIVIDTIVITRKKIVRVSGKGVGHLIFLGILLIILLGIQPGLVL
jgi:uncharacterized protein YkwD